MVTDRFRPTDGGYVPDPERDTAAVIDGLFAHLVATLRERSLPEDLVAGMRTRLGELERTHADMITDDASRYNLRMTVALVAAHEALQHRLGSEDAIAVIQTAFTEPLGPAVRAGTRAMLDAARDPFQAMVELCKSREQNAFGAAFTFRRPADDSQRYHLDVHRCFYHDVLAASSTTELTPVMCAFDKAWIEAIDPATHGFRFDRSTTIGYGGSYCPFHFTRTRSGTATSD